MHVFSITAAALSALVFAGTSRGYYIDPNSCQGDDFTFVKSMVDQAFTMVNLAVANVQAQPMDANTAWLLHQLFNADGNAAQSIVNNAFVAGQPNNKGEVTGISVFANQQTDLNSLGVNEVAIFCDTGRLQRRIKDPLHLYDSVVQRTVGVSNGCSSAFMYTQTFDNHWDVIQVCPWFLQYATAKKYQTKADLTSLRAVMAVSGLDKLITNNLYTPIDLMSLWDKCMLHEMMHTKPGGTKQDVNGAGGYGWKNCVAMAGSTGPNNADSWALFGSANYWFNQGSPIDASGNFVSPAMSSQSSNSRRWLGSGPGRGTGVSKADAVKMFM